jgi:hypothetical protein
MSVTASQVLEALYSITANEPGGEFNGYPDQIEWEEVDGALDGPYLSIKDDTQPYGRRYERGPAPVFDGFKLSVETEFGGEGEGDSRWIVIKAVSDDGTEQFFRMDGYYASYDGSTWDGEFYEVRPREKTITVYEDKVTA